MFNYSSDEMWDLFRELPEDLKDASFSERNGQRITNICQRYELDYKTKQQILKLVGYVLFGLLPPNKLTDLMVKDLGLKKEIAEKIYIEINAFVFFKVKDSLEKLYNIKITDKEVKKEEVEKAIETDDKYKEPID